MTELVKKLWGNSCRVFLTPFACFHVDCLKNLNYWKVIKLVHEVIHFITSILENYKYIQGRKCRWTDFFFSLRINECISRLVQFWAVTSISFFFFWEWLSLCVLNHWLACLMARGEIQSSINKSNEEVFFIFLWGLSRLGVVLFLLQTLLVVEDLFIIRFLEVLFHLSLLMNKGLF